MDYLEEKEMARIKYELEAYKKAWQLAIDDNINAQVAVMGTDIIKRTTIARNVKAYFNSLFERAKRNIIK